MIINAAKVHIIKDRQNIILVIGQIKVLTREKKT